jgi:protein-L-isoaspartate(D-aspartate) O-methyltransferase
MNIDQIRRQYAAEIRERAGLRSQRLVDAFATVPRERFLGPGPWKIAKPDPARWGEVAYEVTEDTSPERVYRNVSIGLNAEHNINNGHPETMALWLDALAVQEGETVYHMGCGTGYYTAILATLAGPAGHVVALEIDPLLAAEATKALRPYGNVTVVSGDGTVFDPGRFDVALINAGITSPPAGWLDRLRDGGRMILPITASMPEGGSGRNLSKGAVFIVEKRDEVYPARIVTFTVIYSCTGLRSEALDRRIAQTLMAGRLGTVQSLRRDRHADGESCWLHGDHFCFSFEPVPAEIVQ